MVQAMVGVRKMFKRALVKDDCVSLRCYVRSEDGLYIAACLDLCLAVQADTMQEAKQQLHEQVIDYLIDAVKEKNLVTRPAPLSEWLMYLWVLSVGRLSRIAGAIGKKASMAFREEVQPSPLAGA